MDRIILFDIDGTLLINNTFLPNVEKIKFLIKKLQTNNFVIGVCTNRTMNKSLLKIVNFYGLNGPIISEGGALIYKKGLLGYKSINRIKKINELKYKLKNILKEFIANNKLNVSVKMGNKVSKKNIIINKDRVLSSTLYLPKFIEKKVDILIKYLQNNSEIRGYSVSQDNYHNLKINIFKDNINKIKTIENLYYQKSVIFITDYEDGPLPEHGKMLKVFSVGLHKEFNNYCDGVFQNYGFGIEEILEKLRRNV